MAETLQMETVHKLMCVARKMRRKRPCGQHCSRTKGWTLRTLCEYPEGISQAKLADALGIRPQSLSEAICSLEEEGFVERRQNPESRRELVVSVTESGRHHSEQAGARFAQDAEELLSALTEEELITFSALLDKILQNTKDESGANA